MLLTLATALVYLATTGTSTAIFRNKGTTSGWDLTNQDHKGTVQQVNDVYLKSPTALKMTQIYDPNYKERYHSEVGNRDIYKKGDKGFYGFSFRLQPDWEFDKQSYNLAQFIADFTDLNCGEKYMPSSMIWLEGNQLYSRVKYGSVCPRTAQKTKTFSNLATVTPGEWHTVIIQANWQNDDSGYYKVWFNGDRVLYYNGTNSVSDGRPFQYRVGLYANGWYDDDHKMKGNQGTRQVWYDDIAAGSTYADVDPKQWDP